MRQSTEQLNEMKWKQKRYQIILSGSLVFYEKKITKDLRNKPE